MAKLDKNLAKLHPFKYAFILLLFNLKIVVVFASMGYSEYIKLIIAVRLHDVQFKSKYVCSIVRYKKKFTT